MHFFVTGEDEYSRYNYRRYMYCPEPGAKAYRMGNKKIPSQSTCGSATPPIPTPDWVESHTVTFLALTVWYRVRDLWRMEYTDSALTLVT